MEFGIVDLSSTAITEEVIDRMAEAFYECGREIDGRMVWEDRTW